MTLWLLLTLAFIVQEPISTSAILLRAYEAHYNIWLIHLLFIAATTFDIALGYYIGRFLTKHFGNSKFILYLRKKLEGFKQFAGEKGMIAALIIYSPILFPISAIFIPWLDVSVSVAALCMIAGEILFWYLYIWLIVLGANSIAANAHYAFYIVIILSIILTLLTGYFSKGRRQK